MDKEDNECEINTRVTDVIISTLTDQNFTKLRSLEPSNVKDHNDMCFIQIEPLDGEIIEETLFYFILYFIIFLLDFYELIDEIFSFSF